MTHHKMLMNDRSLLSLLLVEGDTDKIFYDEVKNFSLSSLRCTIKNLEGLYNINQKIIDCIENYVVQHKKDTIRLYCCLDRESRYERVPGFDITIIKKYIKEQKLINILSIDSIIATQQLESWFFYDIEGIYRFLKVPQSQRNPNAFKPPEKYGYKQLQKLFERNSKTYSKGKRCQSFIKNLNTRKIASNCKELHDGIELIKLQANDPKNHIFPDKNTKS